MMRLKRMEITEEAILVTISEDPLAQLLNRVPRLRTGRTKYRFPFLRKKKLSPITAGTQYPATVASAAPATPHSQWDNKKDSPALHSAARRPPWPRVPNEAGQP